MPDIDFQKIVLNLIPKKGDEPVVFYASQYETTRPFIADLFWGDTEFAPGDDYWAEIDIRKNDDNVVVITDDVTIDNNEVSVILPVQAVTCIGKNLGQVKIYAADDHLVAALNFILEVQADPLAGGVTSETAIDNLTQQIEDIATEVIGEDYYDKTEVDALLADKADVSDLPDMSLYYTKTATDTLLNAKADAATTYTKSETDSLLSAKANTADLATVATTGDYDDLINKPTIPAAQIQSDYTQADNTAVDYIKNKPDIDAMIAAALLAVMPVDSATGNPCSFDTDIATSLVGLSAEIVASGGGGTPSTPIPIVGVSSLDITANGTTHTIDLGGTRYGGVYTADGKFNDSGYLKDTFTYGETALIAINQYGIANFGIVISTPFNFSKGAIANCLERQYTSGADTRTEGFFINASNELYVRLDSTRASTVEEFIAWANANLEILFTRATPIEIDVSAISVNAVSGVNNISSNGGGDVTAQYKVSIQKYVDDQ